MLNEKSLDRFIDDFIERMHVMSTEQLERLQFAVWAELTDREQNEEGNDE